MGDFLPGYVLTLVNPQFNKNKYNIVVIGQENGKIYGTFDTKEDFLKAISTRTSTTTMMCYYSKSIVFTPNELSFIGEKRIFLLNDKQVEKVRYAIQRTSSFF